ncbi:MAG: riboflavin synthase [Gemmatimonadota bacterium]|nr:riboflavin synthase [Gemmatimonadota bacterium]
MFTGIVTSAGRVTRTETLESTRRVWIEAPELTGELRPGDSIAVDGGCLTATAVEGVTFTVDVIGTTLERTVAGGYEVGQRLNLEPAMALGDRLDGHLVQGHVDGIGHLMQSVKSGEYWIMDFEVPVAVFDLTVQHGSITLNGVSLTVSDLLPDRVCRIGVIPFTYEHTNLGDLTPGGAVNVEGDLIGKYVERILANRGESERTT